MKKVEWVLLVYVVEGGGERKLLDGFGNFFFAGWEERERDSVKGRRDVVALTYCYGYPLVPLEGSCDYSGIACPVLVHLPLPFVRYP
jgi:hypothetical protein